jgi:folate-binding protein YgfZ
VSSQHVKLDNEALLHIVGPDSLTFLQGQTTCDTRSVDGAHAIVGAYCTPKGRVVCDFLLCQIAQDHYALRMRRDILDTSAAIFGKYIVFSKAELQTAHQGWQLFGCWGNDVKTALQGALGPFTLDGERYASACGEGFLVIQTDEEEGQFECYINTECHPQLVQQLAAAMPPGQLNSWRCLHIEQGMARIEAATVEEFIPQMLNYDLTGHISFNKGCYTGQEVVARMHYRGKPKRRLYRACTTQSHPPPTAGTQLYRDESQQSVGTLVNSATGSNGLSAALIVAPVEGTGSSLSLHLADPNGPVLRYDSTG